MDFLTVLEYTAFIVTVGFFLTGIEPMQKLVQTKDTKNVPYEIFLLSVLSCITMMHYAWMLGMTSIFILNIIGSTLNTVYVGVYLAVVKDKNYALVLLSAVTAVGAAAYYYAFTMTSEPADVLGTTSSVTLTFIMCLPALELINNFTNKNSDGMPASLLWAGNLSGSIWLLYGYLLNDPNIYVPNIPALIINCAKLYAIQLYGGKIKAD